MTIVAAVKSRDGVVLGTDSVSSVTQMNPNDPTAQPQFLKSYANATKLFRLGEHVAAATWGSGNIAGNSISGIVHDFAQTMKSAPAATVEDVTGTLRDFVAQQYEAAFAAVPETNRPILGFLVGGYSPSDPLPELWELRFPLGQPLGGVRCVRSEQQSGANWRGIELPFTRLHMGYDPRLLPRLVAAGLTPDSAAAAVKPFEAPVVFDSMPVQDAIDFAKHVLRTTIAYSTFEVGVPACGEPLQVAVVLRTGFEWIDEPRFHL